MKISKVIFRAARTQMMHLNKYAPKKKKVLRGNEKPHMNKNLRRAIMKGLKLKNKGNKTTHPLDIINYKNNVIM